MYNEIGENIFFDNGMVFHMSFARTYRGMSVINTRRKLKVYYTSSQQDRIIKYLKDKKLIFN